MGNLTGATTGAAPIQSKQVKQKPTSGTSQRVKNDKERDQAAARTHSRIDAGTLTNPTKPKNTRTPIKRPPAPVKAEGVVPGTFRAARGFRSKLGYDQSLDHQDKKVQLRRRQEMKQFQTYLSEDEAPQEDQEPLKNPSLLHNDYNDALEAAQAMSLQNPGADMRSYILSYKYATTENIKKFVVIQNKQLISQAPDWENKGYTIIAWISKQDGLVTRTEDGRYVRDTGNQ